MRTITLREALDRHMVMMKGLKEEKSHRNYTRKLLGKKNVKGKKEEEVDVWGFSPDKLLNELTDFEVQELIMQRRSEGNGNATIMYELLVLAQTIKQMKRQGYAVPFIEFKELRKENQVKPSKGRLRYLSPREEDNLLRVGILHRGDTFEFIVLLLDTCARFSEISSLKWEDVNLEEGWIRLWRSKVNNETILYLTDRAKAVLELRHNHKVNDYVFPSRDGKSHRKYTAVSFKKMCDRAGLEGISFHHLRHTGASKLVQNNINISDVQAILGHSTPQMTNRYAHLVPSVASKRAVEVMNKLHHNE